MTDAKTSNALPWDGQPYSIMRHGVTITNCDTEPVETPGCVQIHGALLVLRQADLTISQASENTGAVLGHATANLLGKSVATVFGSDATSRLRAFLAAERTENDPLHAFTIAATGDRPALDVTIHTVVGFVVAEFEVALAAVDGHPDYYAVLKKSVARLHAADTLTVFCHAVTEEIREMTGFDRVMVYKFHADHSGEVVAESKREDLPPWLGLHYPAEDIPKPARDIFTKIWVRPVPNVDGGLAELVPLLNPDTGKPLVMTHCVLRGPSIMYTEYLRNMGVTACLTLSFRRGDGLWGLIACHHYAGPKPVPHAMRTACGFLAQVASLQHKLAEDREHAVYRRRLEGIHEQLVAQAALEGGLSAMTDGQPALLEGLAAGGAALYHRNRWWRIGVTPDETELEALAEWLDGRPEFDSPTGPLYATDSLVRDYPVGAKFADVASGVLAFPLSRTERNLMMWFRPETIQTVHWGGNPHDMPTALGPHGLRLTPRTSFELWKESVRQRSLPWHPVEVEAAVRRRLLFMELIVSRAEHLAHLNVDLVRSNDELDAFAYVAGHDLKEPLRGICNYAHQLIEDFAVTDPDHRRKLEGLMRLAVRMDGLIDSLLHYSRVGRVELLFEEVDLNEVLAEAIEMVGFRVADGKATIVAPRLLPAARCDRVRTREIFVNLLSNALKYNDKPKTRIEIGFIRPEEVHARPGRPEEATPHTIYFVNDNGIGIHPKHFSQVFNLFKRLHGRDDFGGGAGAGLTIVKKLIDRHHGQVWLDSTLDQGSTFFFTLPCENGV
jgi:two-component system, chemotaxis family, sensor kinase Cph1